ncbi:hypothetical protein ACFQY5_36605 [Paeniroseomonas aquatica]
MRHQLSEQVAAQAVEDAAEGVSGAVAPPRGRVCTMPTTRR